MSSLLIIASQFIYITTLQNLINIVAIILWYLYSPSRIKYPIFNIISGTIGVAILCVNMIFPESVNILYIITKSYLILLLIRIIYETFQYQFIKYAPKSLIRKSEKPYIDIILPCYNPVSNWENIIIEKHKEISEESNSEIRFIVVNDGSKKGFTEDAQNKLLKSLPNTLIIDNKQNKGKGAAIRQGLKISDSDIALYTDYDFPYHTGSICDVISALEKGYDIVIGKRNRSYYSQLTAKRKLASYGSQVLNFMLLGLSYTDTQGGLKGFNATGKRILESTNTNEFLFDTEFIYKASNINNINIKNVDVNLRNDIILNNMNNKVITQEIYNLFKISKMK